MLLIMPRSGWASQFGSYSDLILGNLFPECNETNSSISSKITLKLSFSRTYFNYLQSWDVISGCLKANRWRLCGQAAVNHAPVKPSLVLPNTHRFHWYIEFLFIRVQCAVEFNFLFSNWWAINSKFLLQIPWHNIHVVIFLFTFSFSSSDSC